MNVADILDQIRRKALRDETFRNEILETRNHADPIMMFCSVCRNHGFELYEMELIAFGEESYAAMKRSTNGGGENSPLLEWEDDYYELFLAELGG